MALNYQQLLGLSNPGFSYAPLFWNGVQSQLSGYMHPQAPQAQPMQQPAASGPTPAMLQNQYNRLAQQASNALNGGLLGYQPSQIQAAGSNPQTYNAPQGNFRNSFAGLQGLLGGGN